MQIPISHNDATNAIDVNVVNINPFLIPTVLVFAAYAACRWYYTHSHKFCRAVLFVCLFLLFNTALLEMYYGLECPVNALRFKDTTMIFAAHTRFMESEIDAQTYARIATYFVAQQTLLPIVRGKDSLNIWDQESDLFVVLKTNKVDPVWIDLFTAGLQAYVYPNVVIYQQHRQLIQTVGLDGARGDIWIFTLDALPAAAFGPDASTYNASTYNDTEMLAIHNPDFTFSGLPVPNYFDASWFMPTTDVYKWSMRLKLPRMPKEYLEYQYGPNFMIPHRNRMQCAENLFTKTDQHLVAEAIGALFSFGTMLQLENIPTVIKYMFGGLNWFGMKMFTLPTPSSITSTLHNQDCWSKK